MKAEHKKEMWSWVKSAGVALILAIIIREFIVTPVFVSGQSMEPTFHNKNRVVITKIHTTNHFDMIVFKATHSNTNLIKRVIGLPGDLIKVENDELYINGERFEEPYLEENKNAVFEGQNLTQNLEVEVPEGYLYVLGDNRRNSTDSRILGFIDEDMVIGKVKFRYYPLSEIGIPR